VAHTALSAGGRIRSLESTADGRIAAIALDAAAICPRCAAGTGCGAGLFGRRKAPGVIAVSVADDDSLCTGSPVTIGLGEHTLLRAALRLYGLPLAGLAAASLAAGLAGAGDLAAGAAALAGLAAGIGLARFRLRALERATLLALSVEP
jgi:sigma-E factor negative regulatory protein RseC